MYLAGDYLLSFLSNQSGGFWTAATAIATWLGLILSTLGILIVWRQLRLNRQAMEDASLSAQSAAEATRISQLSSRPWVSFALDTAYIHLNSHQPNQIGCQLNYRAKNIGKTPALRCGLVYRPYKLDRATSRANILKELIDAGPALTRTLFPEEGIGEGISTQFQFDDNAATSPFGLGLVAAMMYQIPGSNEWHYTPIFAGLQPHSPIPGTVEYSFQLNMGNIQCHVMQERRDAPDPT